PYTTLFRSTSTMSPASAASRYSCNSSSMRTCRRAAVSSGRFVGVSFTGCPNASWNSRTISCCLFNLSPLDGNCMYRSPAYTTGGSCQVLGTRTTQFESFRFGPLLIPPSGAKSCCSRGSGRPGVRGTSPEPSPRSWPSSRIGSASSTLPTDPGTCTFSSASVSGFPPVPTNTRAALELNRHTERSIRVERRLHPLLHDLQVLLQPVFVQL